MRGFFCHKDSKALSNNKNMLLNNNTLCRFVSWCLSGITKTWYCIIVASTTKLFNDNLPDGGAIEKHPPRNTNGRRRIVPGRRFAYVNCFWPVQIIFLGSTHSVNCSSVSKPSSRAAWRRVLCSVWAFLAILAALS